MRCPATLLAKERSQEITHTDVDADSSPSTTTHPWFTKQPPSAFTTFCSWSPFASAELMLTLDTCTPTYTHTSISLSSSPPWRPKQNQYNWQLVDRRTYTSISPEMLNWNWAAEIHQRPGVCVILSGREKGKINARGYTHILTHQCSSSLPLLFNDDVGHDDVTPGKNAKVAFNPLSLLAKQFVLPNN